MRNRDSLNELLLKWADPEFRRRLEDARDAAIKWEETIRSLLRTQQLLMEPPPDTEPPRE